MNFTNWFETISFASLVQLLTWIFRKFLYFTLECMFSFFSQIFNSWQFA